MATMNQILVECVRSNKSNNMVWAVYVQGNEQNKNYCKNALNAMRLAFFLKKKTGAFIENTSLALLSLVIREKKASTKDVVDAQENVDDAFEKPIDVHELESVLAEEKPKPKRGRKPSSKKEKVAE